MYGHSRMYKAKCQQKIAEEMKKFKPLDLNDKKDIQERGLAFAKVYDECLENEIMQPKMEEIKKDYSIEDRSKLRKLAKMRLDIEEEVGRKYNYDQSMVSLMKNAQISNKFMGLFEYPEEIYLHGTCVVNSELIKGERIKECADAEQEIRNIIRGLGSKK